MNLIFFLVSARLWSRAGRLSDLRKFENTTSFVITRHPFTRIVSAYRNKFQIDTRIEEQFIKRYSRDISVAARGKWNEGDPDASFAGMTEKPSSVLLNRISPVELSGSVQISWNIWSKQRWNNTMNIGNWYLSDAGSRYIYKTCKTYITHNNTFILPVCVSYHTDIS